MQEGIAKGGTLQRAAVTAKTDAPGHPQLQGAWPDVLAEAPEAFLRTLRALHQLQTGGASKRESALRELEQLDVDGRWRETAVRVGLCRAGEANKPELTSLGRSVGDGVKQYVNWCEHKGALPRGMRPEWVTGRDVLDVGCGVGCALLTFSSFFPRRLAGADLLAAFLELAYVFARREGLPPPELIRANGSRLPFASRSFDTIFCRLALNYMPSGPALCEMARVLRPGGTVVVILNTLRWDLKVFGDNVRAMRLKTCLFDLFKFSNGGLLMLTGRQLTLRFPGRMHSSHSPVSLSRGMVLRQLRRAGFEPLGDDALEHPMTPAFAARLLG